MLKGGGFPAFFIFLINLNFFLAMIKKICKTVSYSASVAQLARAQPCQG